MHLWSADTFLVYMSSFPVNIQSWLLHCSFNLFRGEPYLSRRVGGGGGYPIPGGYSISAGGYPFLTWLGVSHPDLAGGYPILICLGRYPIPVGEYPIWTWPGWPDHSVPPKGGTWSQPLGYPPERTLDYWKFYGIEMGYSPRCGQTDWCLWKHNLPS